MKQNNLADLKVYSNRPVTKSSTSCAVQITATLARVVAPAPRVTISSSISRPSATMHTARRHQQSQLWPSGMEHALPCRASFLPGSALLPLARVPCFDSKTSGSHGTWIRPIQCQVLCRDKTERANLKVHGHQDNFFASLHMTFTVRPLLRLSNQNIRLAHSN